MIPPPQPTARPSTADVCLLLEGTYPYVKGGVSTWVDQIISGMPDLTFSILFIGSEKRLAETVKYPIPSNVIEMRECFLFDSDHHEAPRRIPAGKNLEFDRQVEKTCRAVDAALAARRATKRPNRNGADVAGFGLDRAMFECLAQLVQLGDFDAFWRHPTVWLRLRKFYLARFPDETFAEFFWNVRSLIEPIWKLVSFVDRVPRARVYHSASNGYAGLLGALVATLENLPFLLSEHGVYLRERIADLLQTEWMPGPDRSMRPSRLGTINPMRELWIETFLEMGKFTYASATRTASLFSHNADLQAEFGAQRAGIAIIPNGIDPSRFDGVREKRRQVRLDDPQRKNVGFFGRVVKIKDVRTLIRAARLTLNTIPDANFLVVGPLDEEEGYADECRALVTELDMADRVHFPGPADPEATLPGFDIMILPSLSEGLPFVILEAFASEIPVVSSAVGACPELILGHPDERPALGAAGAIVPVGDAAALAAEIVALLGSRALQDRQGSVGRVRLEKFYHLEAVTDAYQNLYGELSRSAAASEPI